MGIADTDELLVLTNFHVVNTKGVGDALRPEDAEIAFERRIAFRGRGRRNHFGRAYLHTGQTQQAAYAE